MATFIRGPHRWTIRLGHGSSEDLTRRLPREQSHERKERCIRLHIRLVRRVVLAGNNIRRSRRRPEPRSLSSTHDSPALTRNDELLLMNQLEAGRSVLRTERHAGRPMTD
jgi:hypothetical protein